MMKKTAELTLDIASKMYQSGDQCLRDIALLNFPELGLDIRKRVSSIEDVFKITGKDSEKYKASDPEDIAPMALKRLLLAHSLLFPDWDPDYSNPNQRKYEIIWRWSSSGSGFSCLGYDLGRTLSGVRSRLSFPDAESAEYFANTFHADWNQLLKQ